MLNNIRFAIIRALLPEWAARHLHYALLEAAHCAPKHFIGDKDGSPLIGGYRKLDKHLKLEADV